jgi:hypothetical protein
MEDGEFEVLLSAGKYDHAGDGGGLSQNVGGVHQKVLRQGVGLSLSRAISQNDIGRSRNLNRPQTGMSLPRFSPGIPRFGRDGHSCLSAS